MTINQTQDEIIEEFAIFDDWLDKYAYIVDLARSLPPIAEQHRTEQYVIQGCQSRVWVDASLEDGLMRFSADSDAIITKGIIALLIRVLDGHTPAEVAAADLYFIDKIGLAANLTPTRANGLVAMIRQMKLYAIAYESRTNS